MKTNNELVEHLVNLGVLKAPGIITAFKGINRKDFVPADSQDFAYEDTALSIGNGQTISQPYTVAFMLELLSPQKGDNILDVGSGSGYTTALLAMIVGKSGEIIGVEIIPELVIFGKENLSKYGFSNVRIYQAEKVLGFLEKAPYDKILVSASTEELPKELVDQLKM